jgi:selenocysteine-specific elongation factor
MKSIIIGTAGHIDHGKTALVKALTGIDADRLAEEKRRGITIDLGFAHMELPGEDGEILRIGFVDVPGHERFVRNMLAGVGGIDLVLLVIAADESIKPQTREHFDILQLLGVRRGITVLPKSDAVDAEMLAVVRAEVEEFLQRTFLESPRSPIIAVSSLTGAGLDELRQAIAEMAAGVQPRNSRALARLPIDRVFTMKGFGTVVTGTLIAGTIRMEDELEVFPTRRRVRVRGVQVHGQSAELAVAGQRTALNLAGASTEDLARGMTLVPPATFEGTRQADVSLRLLASAPRPLKQRARVHFHSYTMETVAEIVLQGEAEGTRSGTAAKKRLPGAIAQLQISPGHESQARIKLPEPALFLPGDRFIIRQFSPVVTIGGGVVLDAAPMPRSKQSIPLERLNDAVDGSTQGMLGMRIARRGTQGISLARLVSETGIARDEIEGNLSPLLAKGVIVRAGDLLVHSEVLSTQAAALTAAVSKFHQSNPLVAGIGKETLREMLHLNPEVFDCVLGSLSREKKLEIAGDLVRLPGRGVVMKDEEVESKKKIEDAFRSAGLKVPALTEVLAGLRIDKARAQKIVTLLLREKVLVKISEELVFHKSALEELRRKILAFKAKSAKIDVAQFKELSGVSRKYAIPLLEYMDRERVTRRVGDAREIL